MQPSRLQTLHCASSNYSLFEGVVPFTNKNNLFLFLITMHITKKNPTSACLPFIFKGYDFVKHNLKVAYLFICKNNSKLCKVEFNGYLNYVMYNLNCIKLF